MHGYNYGSRNRYGKDERKVDIFALGTKHLHEMRAMPSQTDSDKAIVDYNSKAYINLSNQQKAYNTLVRRGITNCQLSYCWELHW